MASPFAELYECLLQREVNALAEEIGRLVQAEGIDALERELLRFALLAFVPSEHSTHALIVSADALFASEQTRQTAWLDCARYLSLVRPPWSEAPILERIPKTGSPSIEQLAGLAGAGRVEIEPLIAASFDRETLADAATRVSDPAGHLLPLVSAVATIDEVHPQLRRASVRTLASQWSAVRPLPAERSNESTLVEESDRCIAADGSIDSVHAVLERDAMLDAPADVRFEWSPRELSRDLGASISIRRIAAGRRGLLGHERSAALIAAADRNYERGESLSEFQLA